MIALRVLGIKILIILSPNVKAQPSIYIGQKGDDMVYGGKGDNTFIWKPGNGNDKFFDFYNQNMPIKSKIQMPASIDIKSLICYKTNTPDGKEILVVWHKPTNEYITISHEQNYDKTESKAIAAVTFENRSDKIDLINNVVELYEDGNYPPTEETFKLYLESMGYIDHTEL